MRKQRLKSRTSLIQGLCFLVFGLIAIQLFRLQVLNHKLYATKANQQQIMKSTIFAKRGEIYFLDGDTPVPIVMNKKTYTISIDPSLVVKKREEITKKIDEMVGNYRTKASWDEVFADPERKYFVVAKDVPYAETNNLKNADLTGVYEQEATTRVYPEGEMAAQVLGFVNQDGEGQYGVEGSLNKELTGENGLLKTVKDSNNVPLTIGNENVKIPAKDGKNLVLTIDRNIQKKAEEAVDEVTKKFNITYGSAIVMNPATGQILAMAGKPGYNPAEYAKVTDAKVFQTDATMNAFNPASVCKTFAIAAAIDSGVMTPETTYYNTDRLVIDGWPIENAIKGHTGEINMQTVLTYSLNTGSIQALKLLGGSASEITYQGKEKLYDYYHNRFNLGKYTGIELPETKGSIVPPNDIDATDARYANMTFGQSLDLSIIQVASAFSAVVNGGEYYRPTLIAGEMKDGKFVRTELAKADHDALNKNDTSRTMRQMLHTGRLVFPNVKGYDEDYYVGGKTGTAQTVKNGKYSFDETIGTYVGFGAKSLEETPDYVIMTKVWSDNRKLDGGMDAKPIFDEISKYMINYNKVRR